MVLIIVILLLIVSIDSYKLSPLSSLSLIKSNVKKNIISRYSNNGNNGNEICNTRDIVVKDINRKLLKTLSIISSSSLLLSSSNKVIALDDNINNNRYNKAPISNPSDDFWYPPYLIGSWNMSMKFAGANFTDMIPLDVLADNDNIPGFSNYSIIFIPDMGKDVNNINFRYVQLDSHPREDHPHNIRSLIKAFTNNDTNIISAPYSFQKANLIDSPANKWTVMYNDSKGYGTINLETQKRDIVVTAGSVETLEFIRQTHIRNQYNNDSNKIMKRKKIIKSDYALKWKLSVPAALNDTFITVQDLRSSNVIVGTLDILVYVQPTNDLYMTLPGRPAGVFSYNIVMERLGDPIEMTNNTEYPFVWKDDGPVELDQYFGY